jgi:hypothetical protein
MPDCDANAKVALHTAKVCVDLVICWHVRRLLLFFAAVCCYGDHTSGTLTDQWDSLQALDALEKLHANLKQEQVLQSELSMEVFERVSLFLAFCSLVFCTLPIV